MTAGDERSSRTITVRLSRVTAQRIDQAAAEAGVSRNAWIIAAIEKHLNRTVTPPQS